MASTPAGGAPETEPKTLLFGLNPTDTIKVVSRDGQAIGTVHALMLNKGTGQPNFAVLALGGFLGIGKSYYPMPFQLLSYDVPTDGYVVTIDRRLLEGGPSWASNTPNFDQAYADRVANYYGVASIDISVKA